MTIVISIVHVVTCFLLIGLVLLQDPKSGGAGSVFGGGGGTNSLLGATGAVTFLTRITRYSAIVFGVTCIILTLLSRPNSGSVIDAAGAAPAAPITAPGAEVPAVGTETIPATTQETAPATTAPAGQ